MRGPLSPFAAIALIAASCTTSCQTDLTQQQNVRTTLKTVSTPEPAPTVLPDGTGRTVPSTPGQAQPPAPTTSPVARVPTMQPTADAPRASPNEPVGGARDSPAATTVLFDARWSAIPIGREPPMFHDPASEPNKPSWLQAGAWPIVPDSPATGVVWQANQLAPQPCLSFRVWNHAALPARYTATIAVRPVSSTFEHPPIGEIALIPFYVDPTHYVEVVVGSDSVSVWLADGAQPGSDKGWRALRFLGVATAIGDVRTVVMTVDRTQSTLTVMTGEQTATIAESALAAQPAGVAIRAVGNRFAIPVFRIESEP